MTAALNLLAIAGLAVGLLAFAAFAAFVLVPAFQVESRRQKLARIERERQKAAREMHEATVRAVGEMLDVRRRGGQP